MDQRSELRLTQAHQVLIKTASGTPLGDADEFTLGHCVDISSDGMKVTLETALTAGYIHEMCVVTEPDELTLTRDTSPIRNFNLVAEVMWCKPRLTNKGYEAGMKIHNSENTQFIAWKQHLLHALQNS